MVLDERIDWNAVGGEIGNHVGIAYDDLSVQDAVIGVVAAVDDKGEIHHHARGVAVAVGAGVGIVGRHTVVGGKSVLDVVGIGPAKHDDASAGAFHFGGDVFPAANGVQVLILHLVRVNRDGVGQNRPIGVLRVLLAAVQEGGGAY